MSNPDGYFGTQTGADTTDPYNQMAFIVRAILSTRAHVALVRVLAVDVTDPNTPLLDVQPLVNQMDPDGNAYEHGVINSVPVFRLQAGASAIRIDPKVDDIGVCLFADRDISSVKQNRAPSNPGSMRQSDMADGMYFGGILNAEPTQFIEFTDAGIRIVSPALVRFESPAVEIEADTVDINASDSATITTGQFTVNGPSQFNGTIDATGTITSDTDVISDTVSGKSHLHTGVQPGGGQSGPPVP